MRHWLPLYVEPSRLPLKASLPGYVVKFKKSPTHVEPGKGYRPVAVVLRW